MTKLRLARLVLLALCAGVASGGSPPAFGAVNSVTGGIGGLNNGTLLGGDGTGAAQITINSVELALRKQARDLVGNVLPDGAQVTPGQEIYFVLYVDNLTPYPADDLQILDQIDESQFRYVSGSLEACLVPTGSTDADLWQGSWVPLTDTLGPPDDGASALDTGGPPDPDQITVGSETRQQNAVVTIPGTSIRAYRFRVQVI
jgi:hypothetical protein